MLKSANLQHKCGLGDSDMSSTVYSSVLCIGIYSIINSPVLSNALSCPRSFYRLVLPLKSTQLEAPCFVTRWRSIRCGVERVRIWYFFKHLYPLGFSIIVNISCVMIVLICHFIIKQKLLLSHWNVQIFIKKNCKESKERLHISKLMHLLFLNIWISQLHCLVVTFFLSFYIQSVLDALEKSIIEL